MSEEVTLQERVTLLKTSLAALYPARVVTRDLLRYEARSPAELKQGIYTIVSLGERDYQNHNGREAMDGNHRILLVGQLMVEETATGEQIEDAEFALVEEIKAYLRAPSSVRPAQLCALVATGFQQSGQVDHPYGAVAFDLECPND